MSRVFPGGDTDIPSCSICDMGVRVAVITRGSNPMNTEQSVPAPAPDAVDSARVMNRARPQRQDKGGRVQGDLWPAPERCGRRRTPQLPAGAPLRQQGEGDRGPGEPGAPSGPAAASWWSLAHQSDAAGGSRDADRAVRVPGGRVLAHLSPGHDVVGLGPSTGAVLRRSWTDTRSSFREESRDWKLEDEHRALPPARGEVVDAVRLCCGARRIDAAREGAPRAARAMLTARAAVRAFTSFLSW